MDFGLGCVQLFLVVVHAHIEASAKFSKLMRLGTLLQYVLAVPICIGTCIGCFNFHVLNQLLLVAILFITKNLMKFFYSEMRLSPLIDVARFIIYLSLDFGLESTQFFLAIVVHACNEGGAKFYYCILMEDKCFQVVGTWIYIIAICIGNPNLYRDMYWPSQLACFSDFWFSVMDGMLTSKFYLLSSSTIPISIVVDGMLSMTFLHYLLVEYRSWIVTSVQLLYCYLCDKCWYNFDFPHFLEEYHVTWWLTYYA